ncbi:TAP42-like protein [Kickxella alabastrina]|uniref:TAP42-like protein n=1 Tax=Kickxella alabastrina TaxID=61397 RepID=UPI00221E4AD5|nr:TAP42-like protein [Kickxella alabastrina]KAI7835013.1 TAP42-like protein [Kickxella alabastrina]KAJ1947644.1 Type 2A phosphatase-associated protein 42 [Kickxella alabastrina]
MEHGETQGASLGINFARAQRQLQAINNTPLASSSVEYQQQVKDLVTLLYTCSSQVGRLSLFSSNETVEDYSTSELKLILINAYLGEALQKLSAPEGRTAVLEEALDQYKAFLTTSQALGIVSKSADMDRILESNGSDAGPKPKPIDPGVSRMQKIERFKRMRAMQQAIAELEAMISGRDSKEAGGVEDEDIDEAERDHAVKLIELKVFQVIDDIDILHSEFDMAKQMEEMKSRRIGGGNTEGSGNLSAGKEVEWRLDSQSYGQIDPKTGKSTQPIFNSKGQPTRPFVLTNDRQRIKDSVFRPDWALPTMTIDEYLSQEQENGNIISGGGKEPDEKPDIDDNNHEALDADTLKKREWDDYKDENPKGMGNRGGNRG